MALSDEANNLFWAFYNIEAQEGGSAAAAPKGASGYGRFCEEAFGVINAFAAAASPSQRCEHPVVPISRSVVSRENAALIQEAQSPMAEQVLAAMEYGTRDREVLVVQEGALKKIVEAIAAKAATDCSSPIGTGTDQAASAAATPTSSDVGGAGNSDVVTPDTAWTSSLGWSADVADEGGASGGVDEYSMDPTDGECSLAQAIAECLFRQNVNPNVEVLEVPEGHVCYTPDGPPQFGLHVCDGGWIAAGEVIGEYVGRVSVTAPGTEESEKFLRDSESENLRRDYEYDLKVRAGGQLRVRGSVHQEVRPALCGSCDQGYCSKRRASLGVRAYVLANHRRTESEGSGGATPPPFQPSGRAGFQREG
eukprot:CAMPEP_0180265628 /NCGR_PEP_ID=MMETSP0988-20121125/561_1 /TAXON_ID=697907 /ORGANISM="non described non described, Strain CCMP2293" /LENGTH=364 /DNA_ID=CAMNT_0022236141 /DNA_START=40 /DNA_END=1131 /DNA_ORIENTATION=-